MITLDDFLQELVAYAVPQSGLGAILDKAEAEYYLRPKSRRNRKPTPVTILMKDGIANTSDGAEVVGTKSITQEEARDYDIDINKFSNIEIIDIWNQLSNIEYSMMSKAPVYRLIYDIGQIKQFSPTSSYPSLNKFQKKSYNQYNQGAIAMAVLRIYQTWASTSSERSLANIYNWMNFHHKKGELELHQDFAQGNMKRARDLAISLYSDSLVAVGDYIKEWNTREKISKTKRTSQKDRNFSKNPKKLVSTRKSSGGN